MLECMHPWGIRRFSDFLIDFGVPVAMSAEVDARLFMDLMTQMRPNSYHIRVEGRHTGIVMWIFVCVIGLHVFIGKHQLPNSPFERHTVVWALPKLVISAILQMHQEATLLKCTRWGGGRNYNHVARSQ